MNTSKIKKLIETKLKAKIKNDFELDFTLDHLVVFISNHSYNPNNLIIWGLAEMFYDDVETTANTTEEDVAQVIADDLINQYKERLTEELAGL